MCKNHSFTQEPGNDHGDTDSTVPDKNYTMDKECLEQIYRSLEATVSLSDQ